MRLFLSLALALSMLAALAGTAGAETPTQQAMASTSARAGCTYFPETGHNLCGGFQRYWQAYGGLAIFGYPITEEFNDPSIGLTVQWFERARFEWHPGSGPSTWDVLLGHVGGIWAQQRGLFDSTPFKQGRTCAGGAALAEVGAGFSGGDASASCVYFPQTGHSLRAGFLRYWETYGGFAIFGYPISEEFTEGGLTVQYFERARFEWQPGKWPARWDVLQGLLGVSLTSTFSYTLPGNQVFPEGVAFDETTGYYYVSSTGDGTIFRGHISGNAASVFLAPGADGRTAATGLKVEDGLLFVSGHNTGNMFVYDANTGALLHKSNSGYSPTFINDVAIGRPGVAFFTDSNNPYLYRVARNASGQWVMEQWIDFTGTPLVYQQGFNVNGIVAVEGGKYLFVVQSNTGKLFRVEIDSKAVVEIDLGGGIVNGGDGMVLLGRTLWVVRQGGLTEVRLSDDLSRGTIGMSFTDPTFISPTTAAYANGRMLVVNSQFSRRQNPSLPFTISSVPLP